MYKLMGLSAKGLTGNCEVYRSNSPMRYKVYVTFDVLLASLTTVGPSLASLSGPVSVSVGVVI